MTDLISTLERRNMELTDELARVRASRERLREACHWEMDRFNTFADCMNRTAGNRRVMNAIDSPQYQSFLQNAPYVSIEEQAFDWGWDIPGDLEGGDK